MPTEAVDSLDLIQIPTWSRYLWLRHGFSARSGGISTVYGAPSLNLGFTKEDSSEDVRENRRILTSTLLPGATLTVPRQIHSVIVTDISLAHPEPGEADALITSQPNTLIAVSTADCVPILLADTRLRIVAAVHAGWRGTAIAIAERTIAHLRAVYNSQPKDLIAAIGPSIGPCCYTVGEEVRTSFAQSFTYTDTLFTSPGSSQPKLNLWEANRLQLLSSGIPPDAITSVALCTACTQTLSGMRRFFSHRDEQGNTGRMLSAIGIAP